MKELNLYLGGSLFTEGERDLRQKEFNKMNEVFGDIVNIYSPMHNDEINDKSKKIDSIDIFHQDTTKVLESDILYCNLEEIEKDSGLAVELGITMGCNIMLSMLEEVLEQSVSGLQDKEIVSRFIDICNETVPMKKIFVNATDIRLTHDNPLVGLLKDASINQYVMGGLLLQGANIHTGSHECIENINVFARKIQEFIDLNRENEEEQGGF